MCRRTCPLLQTVEETGEADLYRRLAIILYTDSLVSSHKGLAPCPTASASLHQALNMLFPSTYHMPGTVLGTEVRTEYKTDPNLAFSELTF